MFCCAIIEQRDYKIDGLPDGHSRRKLNCTSMLFYSCNYRLASIKWSNLEALHNDFLACVFLHKIVNSDGWYKKVGTKSAHNTYFNRFPSQCQINIMLIHVCYAHNEMLGQVLHQITIIGVKYDYILKYY